MQGKRNDERPRRRGRPSGGRYGRAIRVRVTPEMDSALRRARRLFGVTASELVRNGLMIGLTACVPDAIAIAEGVNRRSPKRLDAIKWLRSRALIAIQELERIRGARLP